MRSEPKPPRSADATTASEVVRWWSAARRDWFSQDRDFDARFCARFLGAYCRATCGELDSWASSAEGSLALLILLDQFPRNAFRGTAGMYASDTHARTVARAAIDAGLDALVEPPLRLFFYLPFAHSENPDDQRLSVRLHRRMGQPWLDHALGHQAIVERFGRFPHRNILLGRASTAAEQSFLDRGGFAG